MKNFIPINFKQIIDHFLKSLISKADLRKKYKTLINPYLIN